MTKISEVTRGSFNLSGCMGRLLAEHFKFQTLDGIREAYSRAFSENEKKARTAPLDAS